GLVLMRATLAACAIALVGCLHRPAAVRLQQPTPIAVAIVVDRDQASSRGSPDTAPDELAAGLARAFDERNLLSRPVGDDARAAMQIARDSRQRLQRLADSLSGDAPLLLLAETKV